MQTKDYFQPKGNIWTSKRLLISVLFLLIISVAGLLCYTYMRVSTVIVNGNENISDSEIVEISGLKIDEHILEVDKDIIAQKVNKNTYLNVLSVEYIFPDTIEINVEEYQKYAVVQHMNQYIYLSKNGIVLEVSANDSINLLQVKGLYITGFSVGETIGIKDEHQKSVMIELFNTLDNSEIRNRLSTIDITNPLDIIIKSKTNVNIKIGQAEHINFKLKNAIRIMDNLGTTPVEVIYAMNENSFGYKPKDTNNSSQISLLKEQNNLMDNQEQIANEQQNRAAQGQDSEQPKAQEDIQQSADIDNNGENDGILQDNEQNKNFDEIGIEFPEEGVANDD